jgi:hypothetical protein
MITIEEQHLTLKKEEDQKKPAVLLSDADIQKLKKE